MAERWGKGVKKRKREQKIRLKTALFELHNAKAGKLSESNPSFWPKPKSIMRVNDLIPRMPAGGPYTRSNKLYLPAACGTMLHMCKFTSQSSQDVLQQEHFVDTVLTGMVNECYVIKCY